MVSLSWFIEIRKYGGKGKIGRVTFNESFAAVGTGISLRWDRVICCDRLEQMNLNLSWSGTLR